MGNEAFNSSILLRTAVAVATALAPGCWEIEIVVAIFPFIRLWTA